MPTDVLLIIDGVPADSKDSKHPGAIEVFNYSWDGTNYGVWSIGGSAGPRNRSLVFTMKPNSATTRLAQACMSGIHFRKAQLFLRKRSGNQNEDVVTLEDLIVTSFQAGGRGDLFGGVTLDQVKLEFVRIRFD